MHTERTAAVETDKAGAESATPLRDDALARLYRMRGNPEATVRDALAQQEALLARPASDDQQAAIGLLDLVIVSGIVFTSERTDPSVRLRRAKTIADAIGDRDLKLRALRLEGMRRRHLGQSAAHNRVLVEALVLAKQTNDARLLTVLHMDFAGALLSIGSPARALEVIDTIADDYLRLRPEFPGWNRAMLSYTRGKALFMLQRFDDTLATLDAAFEDPSFPDAGVMRWYLLALYARTLRRSGVPCCPDALAQLIGATSDTEGLVSVEIAAWFQLELAARLEQCDPTRALELARTAVEAGVLHTNRNEFLEGLRFVATLAESLGDLKLALATERQYSQVLQDNAEVDAEATREMLESEEALYTLQLDHERERLRAGELSQIVDRLSDLHADMESIVQDAVHDIGGPLTALQFATQRLRDTADVNLAPRSLGFIESAVDTIRDIIRSLIDERGSDGRPPRTGASQVALDRLLRGAMPTFQAMAAVKGSTIELALEAVPPINANRVQLRRIVTNVLSNAIKFSPPGATIRVELAAVERSVLVRVADEGPGFPPDFADLIARGARHDATPTGGESSTGLGLAIVLRYVEELGATIRFDNTDPGGEVTLQIPF